MYKMYKSKVVLFTIVESYNEDEFINHHGFKRNVPETPEKLFTTRTKEEEDIEDTDADNTARPKEKSNKKKNKVETIAKTLGNYYRVSTKKLRLAFLSGGLK